MREHLGETEGRMGGKWRGIGGRWTTEVHLKLSSSLVVVNGARVREGLASGEKPCMMLMGGRGNNQERYICCDSEKCVEEIVVTCSEGCSAAMRVVFLSFGHSYGSSTVEYTARLLKISGDACTRSLVSKRSVHLRTCTCCFHRFSTDFAVIHITPPPPCQSEQSVYTSIDWTIGLGI